MSKVKYITVSKAKRLNLDKYPNAGPYPNITGMKRMYWGKDAYVVRSGKYAYKVPKKIWDLGD